MSIPDSEYSRRWISPIQRNEKHGYLDSGHAKHTRISSYLKKNDEGVFVLRFYLTFI